MSVRIGDLKTPYYDEYRVVDSRKLTPEQIAAGQFAVVAARQLKVKRVCREQGFQYSFQAAKELDASAPTCQ